MTRPALPENWYHCAQNGKVWYQEATSGWTAELSGSANKAWKWRALDPEQNAMLYGPTLTWVMRSVDERLGIQRNDVQPPKEPNVQEETQVPRGHMDPKGFECACGRRYVVQVMSQEAWVQDNGFRRRAQSLPVGNSVAMPGNR